MIVLNMMVHFFVITALLFYGVGVLTHFIGVLVLILNDADDPLSPLVFVFALVAATFWPPVPFFWAWLHDGEIHDHQHMDGVYDMLDRNAQ